MFILFYYWSCGKWDQNTKKDILTELILNETVEILLPIAFIGTYASAYYGPNKNTLWHIGVIENLMEFLVPIAKMALIDSGSLILAGILLRWFCRINILREYCNTIKKYWVYLAFWGGASLTSVSVIYKTRKMRNTSRLIRSSLIDFNFILR